ncbi:MAG: pseudouridine synthase [Candidatus Adlerbacteria bacterium]|nr:pseudouridine synthase [Candidatus Adlerbacteria bacterium]
MAKKKPVEIPEEPKFPMRINKYLAFKKQTTRREADVLIGRMFVTINGTAAKLGDKVSQTDIVKIGGPQRKYRYYAYNKPQGIITHSPQGDEVSIADSINMPGIFPMGRLDKDSDGLILLTDDGRVTDALLNPKHEHEKEYVVTTLHMLPKDFKRNMERGVDIGDYITKKCTVEILSERSFSIILTEGKKHQIRRMCGVFGQSVVQLTRVRIMDIHLGSLAEGAYREMKKTELSTFLQAIGL